MTTAVILTTYNRPDALSLVLSAYNRQSDADFTLIVADDGSREDTAEVIATFQRCARMPVIHVWHEDRGFRAAAIRNRAIAAAGAEYVIFSDGDCVPAAQFVAGHRRLAERGWFVAGSRILLSEGFTQQVLAQRLDIVGWQPCDWRRASRRRDVNRWLATYTLPLPGAWRKLFARNWHGIMTCNLSCWRDDLIRINGFDEEYEGWGMEDSDLVIRLINSGVFRKSARFFAPVFHLWHHENDRSGMGKNQQRLQNLIKSASTNAPRGIGQYL